MFFYALYSKSQKSYNTPFLANNDKEAVAIIAKTVVAQQDPSLVMCLDDLTLNRVGLFVPSNDTPVMHLENRVVVMEALHERLPLPPMIKSQVDKIYARKETFDGTAAQ